jgi:endonuclease/exonuclease/phosphatase family metal-dependent hydrolase
VDSIPEGHDNLFCAFLWNADRVRLLDAFAMDVPNYHLAGAYLFDRKPLVGYFEAVSENDGTNDFVVINVHMKSGQDNYENHLIAMVVLEHGLSKTLEENEIKESDRIILGDFNDNPYLKKSNGQPRYSGAMYSHMAYKGYVDLVTEGFHSTRMDLNLTSVLDHILVNSSAKMHVTTDKADIFLPGEGDSTKFADWRKTYSDHFPVSFTIKIEDEDDDVDFSGTD